MRQLTRRSALGQPTRPKLVLVRGHKRRKPSQHKSPYPPRWWAIQDACYQLKLQLTPREKMLIQKLRARRRKQRQTDALVRRWRGVL